MNYWERWIGDWKRKTAHLSLAEKGAYGELLDHQYAHNLHLLPLDHRALYRVSGAVGKEELAAIDSVISGFYEKQDAGYRNKRASEEITKRQNYAAGQAERANRRWHPDEFATPAGTKSRANGAKPPAPGFDAVWSAYPRHTARATALNVWTKLAPDDALQGRILAAVEVQKKSEQWTRDAGQYIPHLASWLNAKRWDDEVTKIAYGAPNGPAGSGANGSVMSGDRDSKGRLITPI